MRSASPPWPRLSSPSSCSGLLLAMPLPAPQKPGTSSWYPRKCYYLSLETLYPKPISVYIVPFKFQILAQKYFFFLSHSLVKPWFLSLIHFLRICSAASISFPCFLQSSINFRSWASHPALFPHLVQFRVSSGCIISSVLSLPNKSLKQWIDQCYSPM